MNYEDVVKIVVEQIQSKICFKENKWMKLSVSSSISHRVDYLIGEQVWEQGGSQIQIGYYELRRSK